jgi:hypothetical protein
MTGEGCLRKAFEDGILKIYSGTAPSTADNAPTGSLLAVITESSGLVTANTRSTPPYYTITLAHGGDAPDVGDTVKLEVDDVDFQYVATAAESTVELLAIKVATLLNDLPQVTAVPSHANGLLYVQGRYAGVDLLIEEDTSTGALTVTVGTVVAAAPLDTLKLLAPSAGVITKNTHVWSGVGAIAGTATYFRLVTNSDLGTDNATDVRIQGTVSTSGADLNMSNTSITVGPTITIDTFALTLPANA